MASDKSEGQTEQVEADEEMVLEEETPDVRCWSSEEMGGHPFKHRRKKEFEEVQSVS